MTPSSKEPDHRTSDEGRASGEAKGNEEGLSAAAAAVEQADVALGKELALDRKDPVAKAASAAGTLGDQGPLYALGASLVVLGLAARRGRLATAGVSMLAAVGAADAGKSLTKRFVKRTRPHVLLEEGRYAAEEGGSKRREEQSFPSGHVAGCVAAAGAVTRIFPESRPWPHVAAAGIGVTRLLKGAHWPLDILAGAIIGVIAELATSALLRLVFGAKKVRSFLEQHASRS